jgi:lactate permease
MLFVLPSLPIVWIIIGIAGLNWPARKVLPIGLILTTIIASLFWQFSWLEVLGLWLIGALRAIEILLIIFGAVWLLEVLKQTKQIQIIQASLASIHPDARVQLLLVGYAFGSFLEGIAGFGTPAAIAAPLLVSLGFRPVTAIIISLLFNSTAVTFGASGTPMLAIFGLVESSNHTWILQTTALLHVLGGILVPIVGMLIYLKGIRQLPGWTTVKQIVPLCLVTAGLFLGTYYLTAVLLGPELPSILGGLAALVGIVILAKLGWLVPTTNLPPEDLPKAGETTLNLTSWQMVKAWLPYVLIASGLLVTRLRGLGLRHWLSQLQLSWPNLLGLDSLSYQVAPLMLPGLLPFLPVVLFSSWLFKASLSDIQHSLSRTISKLGPATVTLIATLGIVSLLRFNPPDGELASMVDTLANQLRLVTGHYWLWLAPAIGALGAFLTGSSTVSNLLFGPLQLSANQALGYAQPVLIVGQLVGSAFGNIFAISNILAAMATVGLTSGEGQIFRYLLAVTIGFLLLFAFLLGGLAWLA